MINIKEDLWQNLQKSNKPVLLYGMGNGADKIIKVLDGKGIKISGVFASDGFVRKKTFHGFNILSYSQAKEIFPDMTVLAAFGSSRPEVLSNFKRIASQQEFYAPDVPVCGNTLFDIEYYQKNQTEFTELEDILFDDVSKTTLRCIVKSKLTGDINSLFDCETDEREPFEGFFKLSGNESYLDLGAYRGDTVSEFVSTVDSYNKIIAVEPDKKTFGKLKDFLCSVDKASAVNACVSDETGERAFCFDGSRGSKVSENGEKIKCVTVDFITAGMDCTYIKMDIEGEEIKALKGAENTIRNLKPKLKIACYHRSEDIIEIPKAVLSVRPDYKVYMRHTPSVPAWDTFYYFV